MKLVQLISHCSLSFFSKNVEAMFDIVLGQYGLIFDDVGWWSGLNKGSDYSFIVVDT